MKRAINSGSEARMYQEREGGFCLIKFAVTFPLYLNPLNFITAKRIALLVCIMFFSLNVWAQNFDVAGTLIYKAYMHNGDIRVEMRRSFTASVFGDKWLIQTVPLNTNVSNQAVEYYEAGSDGTDSYYLTRFNKSYDSTSVLTSQLESIKSQLSNLPAGDSDLKYKLTVKRYSLERIMTVHGQNKESLNDAVGEIYSTPVPLYDIDFVQPIWLAYASSLFLDGATNSRLPRVWDYDHPLQKFTNNRVKAVWERLSSFPKLPKEIIFYNEGIYYTGSHNGSEKHMESLRLSKPYDEGYTNAIYHVDRMTNFYGQEMPLHFTLTRFERVNDAKHNTDLQLETTFEGIVERISPCSKTNFVPAMPVSTVVEDHRFFDKPAEPDSIEYLAKSGGWLDKNEVRDTKSYRTEKTKLAMSGNDQLLTRRKTVILCILGAMFVFPILIGFKYVLSEKNKKQNRME